MRARAQRSRHERRGHVLAGLALAALLGGRPIVAPAEETEAVRAPETWFATAVVRGDVGMQMIDYWSRGPNMRARTLMSGHPITTIVFGGRYIAYDELTGKGIDIGRAPRAIAADANRLRPFAFELDEVRAAGGERIEELVFGARKGEIWQVTDARGKRKVWVTVGTPRVPLRFESFERKGGTTIDIDYQNWIFDLEMPDPFFAPPPDVELERLEYDVYLKRSLEAPVGTVPVLYPDLLHGLPPA